MNVILTLARSAELEVRSCYSHHLSGWDSKNLHMLEVPLCLILKEKIGSLGTLDRGSKIIMERLRRKNVFHCSFGGGTQVIIVEFMAELHWAFEFDQPSRPKLSRCFTAHVKGHN